MPYRVKITALALGPDLRSMSALLAEVPGMSPKLIATGLKSPPFALPHMDEAQARELQAKLEPLGATCVIERVRDENALVDASPEVLNAASHAPSSSAHYPLYPSSSPAYMQEPTFTSAVKHSTSPWLSRILLIVLGIAVIALLYVVSTLKPDPTKPRPRPPKSAPAAAVRPAPSIAPSAAPSAQNAQNAQNAQAVPDAQAQATAQGSAQARQSAQIAQAAQDAAQDPAAFKQLEIERLAEGDIEGADKARAAYDRVRQSKLVMASVNQQFGGAPKVEVTEERIICQAAYPMTDKEFYEMAKNIYDTLAVYYPSKGLLVENHTAKGIQRIHLGARQPFPRSYP
jgi:hypothetical protein